MFAVIWFTLSLVARGAAKKCRKEFVDELRMHLRDFPDDFTVNTPAAVKHFKLDPAPNIMKHFNISVDPMYGCTEICALELFSGCIDFTLKVNHVDIQGASTLAWGPFFLLTCEEVHQGDSCSSCSTAPGDSDFGLDVRLHLQTKMKYLKSHIDMKGGEGSPDGIRAFCHSNFRNRTWSNVIWYGIADCVVEDATVDIVVDVCGSICGDECKDIASLSCIKIRDLKIKFDETKSNCVFSHQYMKITNFLQWLDKHLFRQVADLVEKILPGKMGPFIDLVLKQVGVPRTCGRTTSDEEPEAKSESQMVAIVA